VTETERHWEISSKREIPRHRHHKDTNYHTNTLKNRLRCL